MSEVPVELRPPVLYLPRYRVRVLHFIGAMNLAVAQPLFDLLGKNPTFFVAHRVHGLELVLFAALLSLGLPALPALASGAASLLLRGLPSAVVYNVLLAGIVSAGALEAQGHLTTPWYLKLILAVAAGSVFVYLLRRPAFRAFVSALSWFALAVPLTFLLLSPARQLLPIAGAPHVESVQVASHTPLVVLLFDELPLSSLLDEQGAIDAARFPNFHRLAQTATWYPAASSVSDATSTAVPAILTGLYPSSALPPTAAAHPRNLFTMLGQSYALNVAESVTQLCPETLCASRESAAVRWRGLLTDSWYVYLHLLLPGDLDVGLPAINRTWRGFDAGRRAHDRQQARSEVRPRGGRSAGEETIEEATDEELRYMDVRRDFSHFLERLRATPGRSLNYLHLQLPHIPWRYLPSGDEYGPIGSNFAAAAHEDGTWKEDPQLIAQALRRHLLQVGYADTVLGQLMDTLEEIGRWDDALVVVLADHGLSFRAGLPARVLDRGNLQDVLAIPLFIKSPGQASGTVDTRNAEVVDLLPTIAQILGVSLEWPLDGTSLVAPRGGKRDVKLAFDDGTLTRREIPFESWTSGREGEAILRSLVGSGDLSSLYRVGPAQEVLGTRADGLSRLEEPLMEVSLAQPWLWDHVDRSSGFSPVYLTGFLRWLDHGERRAVLAVALNGEVVATTRSYHENEIEMFSAMLPEQQLRDGANRIAVFSVHESAGTHQLRPTLDRSPPSLELMRDAQDGAFEVRATASGESCRQGDAVRGRAERIRNGFHGWATLTGAPRARVLLMVFLDGKLVHREITGRLPPRGWPEAGQADLQTSGFRFRLSPSLLQSAERLRIVGMARGQCSEVPIAAG